MKGTLILLASFALASPAFADDPKANSQDIEKTQPMSPGATQFAPGQQDRANSTSQGATQFAPGQQDRSAGQPGATQFAPGQQMNTTTSKNGGDGDRGGADKSGGMAPDGDAHGGGADK